MTPLRAQALLEPEDSSSSDFVESPEEETSPEVSDSDGGNIQSGADDRRGASEASPSLTVTSGASGELDTTGRGGQQQQQQQQQQLRSIYWQQQQQQ
ncbi:hypothetical protein GUITHDRAFT_101043 [Guillardia theta CCMP2712]|uniref:Uncharacterized protein n=1 Tax=Guillardia theta (strain CCMP2712) TaxID=905079 RepID=L1JYB6_GUITC|nr:hypothetical protein GUITHDRAFT_101043 [Guillardia theta CCMP2712]EKX53342.1 hypothetical protein GUITHDRAFT_101043 [Guillardia theta CCMP2712]|eukprot:XP_005840322.1 hypothetical protein GUITHDRAFT_101043 [Guillardia theta CCMP2712]